MKRSPRRRKAAPLAVLGLVLVTLTVACALVGGPSADASPSSAQQVADGQKLFAANCASCHGLDATGSAVAPSLIGVGAASVDFQVGTGRMPMQNTAQQVPAKKVQFTSDQIAALAAYVASLSPGPPVPSAADTDLTGADSARGMELFRTNCAMCHNSVGAGGALSDGKYAPNLQNTTTTHLFEAMQTGPGAMPVFNDSNISVADKRDIAAYVATTRDGSPGGLTLGSLGPVAEGLWAWLVGIGLVILGAIWVGGRSKS